MIKERRLHPVIVFSFARRELELLAADVAHKLDFSTAEEAENIEEVFNSAIQVRQRALERWCRKALLRVRVKNGGVKSSFQRFCS